MIIYQQIALNFKSVTNFINPAHIKLTFLRWGTDRIGRALRNKQIVDV